MSIDDISAEHSITMWGPPATGKTTFLAALNLALIRRGSVWSLKGEDDESTNTLIKLTTELTKDRSFPQGTQGILHYRWALDGKVTRKVPRKLIGWKWRDLNVRIHLDLVDSPGLLAGPKRDRTSARSDLVNNLMNSSGILFLYDPIREFDKGDAFDHTYGLIQQLSQRGLESPGQRLPHYVAVCITKFDEIRVLATADKLDLIEYDPDPPGFPKVHERDAKEFFSELCKVPRDTESDLVLNLLEQSFEPDRVKYFVTSAIGFYVDTRKGYFDPNDYQNHLPDPHAKDEQKQSRIRGPIHPINVVEPLLWLTEKLTAGPGR